ncbi:MAG: mannosyltransferase family protein [Pseudomonadota bacterium]
MRNKIQAIFSSTPEIRRAVTMALLWLVVVNGFGLIALNRLNLAPDKAFSWMTKDLIKPPPQNWDIINLHNRWDSYWYLDIAKNGYYLRGEKDIANIVFFPLYPLLMRMLAPLAGGNLVVSGWIVSSLFLVLATGMLVRLTQTHHPDIDPLLPVVFLLAYPTAFILNAVYSESLFLFLSLAVVYYARQQRFLLASVFAAFASATRIAGLFLCVLLLVEILQAYGFRSLFSRRVLPLALAPSGAVAFFSYHWIAFGDFFLYLKVEFNWGRDFEMAASDFVARNNAYLVNMANDLFFLAMGIVIGIVALRRLRISYGVYMLVSMGIALSSGTTLAVARYSMMLFPIYLFAASIGSITGRSAWLLSSVLLLALNIISFANHYWIG